MRSFFRRWRAPAQGHWYDGPPPGAVEGRDYYGIKSWPAIYLVQGYDLDGPPPWESGQQAVSNVVDVS